VNISKTSSIILGLLVVPSALKADNKVALRLVSARDHIEGSFLVDRAVYADADRIYLASYQGQLFVLARDRSADFPLIEIVQDTVYPLTAVGGDSNNLYVTTGDGNLRVYRKDNPLVLTNTVPLSEFRLSTVVVQDKNLYVSNGQASLAVDRRHVYLSELNEGDVAFEVDKETLLTTRTYGQVFEAGKTVIFERTTGERIISIDNPGGVALYADQRFWIQTIPGCCGISTLIYDPKSLSLEQIIPASSNAVVRSGWSLIVGNEGGFVAVFDLRQNPSPLLSSVDLPSLTGHTGIEDIEIRAVWHDKFDNLIFAGSSWGNDQSRGPLLPSFFVLELVTD